MALAVSSYFSFVNYSITRALLFSRLFPPIGGAAFRPAALRESSEAPPIIENANYSKPAHYRRTYMPRQEIVA